MVTNQPKSTGNFDRGQLEKLDKEELLSIILSLQKQMNASRTNRFSRTMQVFISSSTRELPKFREEAIRAVTEAGLLYKNFNDRKGAGFTQAKGGDIFEMNRNAIQTSDVFVGLYGFGRVWSPSQEPDLVKAHPEVAHNHGKPIMEFEYEWAEEAGLYMFPFLRTYETRGANPELPDARMDQLRSRLRSRSVGWLTTPAEFYDQIKEGLLGIVPRAFLSYSRKDRESVINLQQALRQQDIHAWRDEANIPGGAEWAQIIQAAIDEMSVLILALTRNSAKSEWVEKECRAFLDNRKSVIPYVLEPEIRNDIPDYLSSIQYIDGTQPHGFVELVKRLRVALKFGS